jgi:hypothetical protein
MKAFAPIAIVCVLLGAGVGFGWHYLADNDPSRSAAARPAPYQPRPNGCCKVCSTGKACGNTCISRAYMCHVGSGCACDR